MSDSDIMSFLTYQNAGGMNTDFTSVKSALKWDPIYYSRTANASYGIGLAAVILNDEAMGYKSKIVFITDSSVSVDSRFLKLAINNKIPIYFFCIGDFNTAALIGYAQLTGGKVYSAKTAAEINQSCNEIGPKTFVGETDTDGDGFTDIEEMSGLIVSSNCKIVNTDYMKADTDDDGLDDNEEVDVELTKVEVPGKQGNPSTFKYYHHMNSDPSKADTDGDGLDDIEDFDPINKASDEELKVINFFNRAELFEIRYLADFCSNLNVSVSVAIDYINVFRSNAAYDYDSVISDLNKLGYKCDNAFFRINYTEYFNYKNDTSFAQLLGRDFNSWSESLLFFISAWILDNSFQSKVVNVNNSYEFSNEQKDVLNAIKKQSKNGKIIDIESAEKVNNQYKIGDNYKPPYKPGTRTITVKLEKDTKFVRVYKESGKLVGGWVMETEQIEGLTPKQIKDKFALQYEPKYVCDVEIPAGNEIRYGIANGIRGWGNGGGIQYDLMGQRIGRFHNERLL